MENNRNSLENLVYDLMLEHASEATDIAFRIESKHNIPAEDIMDYMGNRKSLAEASDFELFCFLEIMKPDKISTYFTDLESSNYKTQILSDSKQIKFPLNIDCIQIAHDQWIGSISAQMIGQLRDNQLINYNVNSQRTMQRIIRKDAVSYRITVNKQAVEAIKKSYEENLYIPNTLTLNIPMDGVTQFGYSSKNKQLTIKSTKGFDIIDGYHRYIAIGRILDENPDWDYAMEVRITNFDEDRCKSFIYQEDQKTKMKRIDSDSMNVHSAAVTVTNKINQNPDFIFKGDISRNGGRMDFAEFSNILDYFIQWDSKASKSAPDNYRLYQLEKLFVDGFNDLVRGNEYILRKEKFDFVDLCIVLDGIYLKKKPSVIVDAIHRKNELPDSKFRIHKARKILFKAIDDKFFY